MYTCIYVHTALTHVITQAGHSAVKHVHTHKLTHTPAHRDALTGVCQHTVHIDNHMLARTQRRAVHTQWAGHEPTHTFIYTYSGSASWALLAALAWAALTEKVWWRSWTLHTHLCVSPTSHAHLPTRSPISRSRAGMHSALGFREHTFLERFLRGDFTQLPIICWGCLSGGLGYKGTEAIDPIKGIPWEQSKKGSTRQIQTATGCWGFPSSGSFFSLCLSLSVFYFMFTFLKRWSRKEREGRETDRKRGREREWVRRGERGRRMYNLHQINVQIPPTPLNLQARSFHS